MKEEENRNGFLDMFEDNELFAGSVNPDPDDNFNERKYQGKGEQRTNQADMERLVQPCIDEEETSKGSRALPWMVPSFDDDANDLIKEDDEEELMVLDDGQTQEQPKYCLEKYFSNGDIQRQNKPRKIDVYNKKRYQGNSSDEDEMERDESDEDFDRDGNPLSLEELDGWMN